MRLIGTVYFMKCFDFPSPEAHLRSVSEQDLTPYSVHTAWLDNVRETIWARTKYKDEILPIQRCALEEVMLGNTHVTTELTKHNDS